jgi:hypothetical protein
LFDNVVTTFSDAATCLGANDQRTLHFAIRNQLTDLGDELNRTMTTVLTDRGRDRTEASIACDEFAEIGVPKRVGSNCCDMVDVVASQAKRVVLVKELPDRIGKEFARRRAAVVARVVV